MGNPASLKWLKRAKDDYAWTEANIREKIWYGACFTAQQAAEKSLKAYLLSEGKKVTKIHDLGALLELCKKSDSSFEDLRIACVTLTDYYAPTRYPDIAEFMSFTEQKAVEALKLSGSIMRFVEKKL